jgi:hypothetical protein
VWSVGRRLFRGVRHWVRTWYEAWGEAGVRGLTPVIRGAGEDPGVSVMEGRALSVLLEVEGCGHTGKVPGGVWEGGRTRDEILTRALKGEIPGVWEWAGPGEWLRFWG